MSGCTGSLAASGWKEGIEEGSRAEGRGDSSRDRSEVYLIVKIIGRGEFFYDVVTQNWNAAKRSLTSSHSPAQLRCEEMRIPRGYSLFSLRLWLQ